MSRKKKILSENERITLLEDYYKMSLKELEIKYKVSTPILYREFEKSGIKRLPKKSKKYEIDESYFEKIDTPNKAYFLGLIMSDGNISHNNRIVINLQENDGEILEKLKIDIKSSKPLEYRKRKSPRKNQKAFIIYNTKIHTDLEKLGVSRNKTNFLEFPVDKVPKELIHHFIRGYFDGDGWICLYRKYGVIFGIICLKSFAIELNNYLLSINIDSKIKEYDKDKYKIKDLVYINIGKKKDIFKLMSIFYENTDVFLKRKYDKYYKAFIEEKRHLYENYTANQYTVNKKYENSRRNTNGE